MDNLLDHLKKAHALQEEIDAAGFGPPPELTDHDLGVLLSSGVRYAMGARSTAPAEICTIVRTHARRLSLAWRRVLIADIEGRRKDVESGRKPGALGDSCDVADWLSLLEFLKGLPE